MVIQNLFKHKKTIGVVIVFVLNTAFAYYPIDLVDENDIPCYCQETNIWCGAATGQMILEGYPGGINHSYNQQHIWDRIHVYNNDPGVNWATEPDGLKGMLMELGGGAGVNWVVQAKSNRYNLMHSIAYWMEKRRYPVATLVYGFQHWVNIVQVVTDVNPVTNANTVLEGIQIFDPWDPPCPNAENGGVDIYMTGANWYQNYWYSPGNFPESKWNGNYVAIIEPPVENGVSMPPQDRQIVSGKVIGEKTAIELAYKYIKEYASDEKKLFRKLYVLKAFEPILVNEHYRGYYYVPFGYEESNIAIGGVLINAYSGKFREMGTFRKPKQILNNDLIMRKISTHIGKDPEVKILSTKHVFEPTFEAKSYFMPLKKISLKGSQFDFIYVTLDGTIYSKPLPSPLGD